MFKKADADYYKWKTDAGRDNELLRILQILPKNVDFEYLCRYLSFNKNLTREYIVSRPELPWDVIYLRNWCADAHVREMIRLAWAKKGRAEILVSTLILPADTISIWPTPDEYQIALMRVRDDNETRQPKTKKPPFSTQKNFNEGLPRNALSWRVKQHYRQLSRAPRLTPACILANPHAPWDYVYLSGAAMITMDFITANPQIPWSYASIMKNPNLTKEFILTHGDKFHVDDFKGLAANKFLHDPRALAHAFKRDLAQQKMTRDALMHLDIYGINNDISGMIESYVEG